MMDTDTAPHLPATPDDTVLRLAIAAHLARYKGRSREHVQSDLRSYLVWCEERRQRPLEMTRPQIELYVRWMQAVQHYKPSTVSRRLSVLVVFYRTCVIDGILQHSPADYVRRPSVPAESPTLGLSHLQFEAVLTASRDSVNPHDFALVSMLGLLGLRIFEACGSDIEHLSESHGHRVLLVHGKGDKVVLTPLPPAVARAIDRAVAGRDAGPILLNRSGTRMDRHSATRRLRALAEHAGVSPPCSTPASPSVTCRSRLGTRTRGPRCATTAPARTSTATPTTSSPPSWHPAPESSARGRPRPLQSAAGNDRTSDGNGRWESNDLPADRRSGRPSLSRTDHAHS